MTPLPPCPKPYNMAQDVLSAGRATPDKIALSVLRLSGAQRISYAQLTRAVEGTGAGLLAQGLKVGDRVLLRLGNTPEFPIAFLGAIWAGLIPAPLSAALTAPEIAGICAALQPALILQDPELALPTDPGAPVLSLDALRALQDHPPVAPDMGDPERPAYIIHTSGTSGVPRAVVHAHRALWARRSMHAGWEGLTPQDRLLHAGAFNWTYTLGTGLMDPWTLGATALIPAPGLDRGALALLLKRHEATIFAAAPGVYRQLLRAAPDLHLPALRHGLSAGEKLPEALRRLWTETTGTPLHEAYGMSECSTFISGSPDRPAPEGMLGFAQAGRRIAVLDEDGAPCGPDVAGMLAVHRDDPGLMLRYDGAPEETAGKFRGDWFLTGDRALIRADGAVHFEGRADDMMNAGGHRVSPLEVESILSTHPEITEIAVTEVEVRPDVTVIGAFYVAPATVCHDALEAFAQKRLATYKCPRIWTQLTELPRSANGKVLRRVLRRFDQGG